MATVVVHRALKQSYYFWCCAWFAIILWG